MTQILAVLKDGKDNIAIANAIEAAINFGMDKNDAVIESARARLAGLSANASRAQDVSCSLWHGYSLFYFSDVLINVCCHMDSVQNDR